MNIVVVYQYYQSTNAPGASLIFAWTQHLANIGHKVTVITGETGYMQCEKPTISWYQRLLRKEMVGKVSVCRTYTYSQLHRSYLSRLLSFISFSLSSSIVLCFRKKPDLIIGSSPPIFPIFLASIVCKIRRIPFVAEVRDLWPESALQMNIIKNNRLISVMNWMERIIYNQAKEIIVLTEGIQKNIVQRGWQEDKISLVTYGVDTSQLFPDPVSGLEIRQRYGLQDKKIILYFGALGEANNIPVMLRAAKRLKGNKNIIFMIVGDGMQRKKTEMTKHKMKLDNVLLLQAVPKTEARFYINSADICLVTLLDIPLFHGALPSKLFDYMACGKPVLCGIGGEAKKLIEKAQAGGAIFEPNDDAQLADLIVEILNDMDRISLSAVNGVNFIQKNYSEDNVNSCFESMIEAF